MGSGIGMYSLHILLFILLIYFLGLCGILAATYANNTYLTDNEEIVLEVLQQNVDLNKQKGIDVTNEIFRNNPIHFYRR